MESKFTVEDQRNVILAGESEEVERTGFVDPFNPTREIQLLHSDRPRDVGEVESDGVEHVEHGSQAVVGSGTSAERLIG